MERSAHRPIEPVVFTAALLAITLVLLVSTSGLRASSALVPRVVGVPLAGLLVYRVIRELSLLRAGPDGDLTGQEGRRPGEIGAILWFLALPTVSTILGFVVGPALYVFVWARYRGAEPLAVAVAAGVVTAAFIQALFAWLLGATLWQGVLGGWF